MVDRTPKICKKKVICFLKKKDGKRFVYVLDFILTLDKMQNIRTLMCKN